MIRACRRSASPEFLASVSLFELPSSIFAEAGLLPGAGLRSLDALHPAAAIRLGVDRVVTYDRRMIEAATRLGVSTVTPD
ncbi:PIN domain-containing protein [Nocardioides sp. B-3]|uniref:PIN domain-containing protein n=1 Tax=Nocardioides sp. B-3 TaxID=2895565 RepID=UPI0021521263|nr:PIN domain-containing protein [Nocardioides sp. B-3]UUZ60537.1 PIN domain-containing protein [Nocardioides sp. B-3]